MARLLVCRKCSLPRAGHPCAHRVRILAAWAAGGCAHALAAAVLIRRWRPEPSPALDDFPGVTILKPLHGAEAALYANLASFCEQDYPGDVQVIFGAHDASDSSVEIVKQLMASYPGRDLELCVTDCSRGPNRKIANLIGMDARIRHDIVVIADSDIAVPRMCMCGWKFSRRAGAWST